MKKVKNEDSTTYTIESRTEVSKEISSHIFQTMIDNKVKTDEVLPLLGDAVANFLMSIAMQLGYEEKEIVKVFGEGLANAEI